LAPSPVEELRDGTAGGFLSKQAAGFALADVEGVGELGAGW